MFRIARRKSDANMHVFLYNIKNFETLNATCYFSMQLLMLNLDFFKFNP